MKKDVKTLMRKYGKSRVNPQQIADRLLRENGDDPKRAIRALLDGPEFRGLTGGQLQGIHDKIMSVEVRRLIAQQDGKAMSVAGRVTIGDYRIVLHADGNYSIQQLRNGNWGLARPNQVPVDVLDQLLTQGYAHRDRVQGR